MKVRYVFFQVLQAFNDETFYGPVMSSKMTLKILWNITALWVLMKYIFCARLTRVVSPLTSSWPCFVYINLNLNPLLMIYWFMPGCTSTSVHMYYDWWWHGKKLCSQVIAIKVNVTCCGLGLPNLFPLSLIFPIFEDFENIVVNKTLSF